MVTPKNHDGSSEAINLDSPEKAVIDAMPTKELFIDMLTRDIALIPAIIDLVDNCADGAKKLKGEGQLTGLWVRLTVSPTEFRIVDNCGGFTVEMARNYAFRFGRPPGAPSLKHSVGQFGVGMKRAIFKIGRNFRVESTTATNRFVVDVDVNKWASTLDWTFEFAEIDETSQHKIDKHGTDISVILLHPDVAEVFGLSAFETHLGNELKSKLQDPIARGLAVTLNGIPVNAEPMTMLANKELAPAYKELTYTAKGEKKVTVKLYCGLGRSEVRDDERAEAGWHVFCNGRLILEGDKSTVTGWGTKDIDLTIPGFHGQYNYLRGFAYFDSDDSARLPWNTTKTGLNTDSPIYRAVKLEMMTLMRPVIDFLNRLKEEKTGRQDSDDKGPLQSALEEASSTAVTDVTTRPLFSAPTSKAKLISGPKMQRIQYDASLDQVEAVKKAINASSWKEVGEKTFQYFFKAEVEE